MPKPKKSKKSNRVVTLEVLGEKLVMDVDTDAGLSLLLSLFMAALVDTNEILRDIRSNTAPA
jgi:hypothetical protein